MSKLDDYLNSHNAPAETKLFMCAMYIVEASGCAPNGMSQKQIAAAAKALQEILLEQYGVET